jgi:hypothetical protein
MPVKSRQAHHVDRISSKRRRKIAALPGKAGVCSFKLLKWKESDVGTWNASPVVELSGDKP